MVLYSWFELMKFMWARNCWILGTFMSTSTYLAAIKKLIDVDREWWKNRYSSNLKQGGRMKQPASTAFHLSRGDPWKCLVGGLPSDKFGDTIWVCCWASEVLWLGAFCDSTEFCKRKKKWDVWNNDTLLILLPGVNGPCTEIFYTFLLLSARGDCSTRRLRKICKNLVGHTRCSPVPFQGKLNFQSATNSGLESCVSLNSLLKYH